MARPLRIEYAGVVYHVTSRGNEKKAGNILVICALALFPGFAAAPAEAGLLYTIPAVEGMVLDATTGEPVSGATVEVKWLKEIYTPIHPQSYVIEEALVATDARGAFRLPERTYFLLFSHFDRLAMEVRHPLQETLGLVWSWKELDAIGSGKKPAGTVPFGPTTIARYEYRDEKLFLTVTPQALEVKYRDSPDLRIGRGMLVGEFYEASIYFRQAKKLGFDADPRMVFRTWERLADRFPRMQPHVRDAEEEVENILRGVK